MVSLAKRVNQQCKNKIRVQYPLLSDDGSRESAKTPQKLLTIAQCESDRNTINHFRVKNYKTPRVSSSPLLVSLFSKVVLNNNNATLAITTNWARQCREKCHFYLQPATIVCNEEMLKLRCRRRADRLDVTNIYLWKALLACIVDLQEWMGIHTVLIVFRHWGIFDEKPPRSLRVT